MVEFNKIRIVVFAVMMAIPMMILANEYSLEECKIEATKDNAEAQWQLGQRYENGDGVKRNTLRALTQYKKAAAKKHRKACAKLANLYKNGILVQKDLVLAAKYEAWAKGENGELAAAQTRGMVEKSNVDEIEIALDYILGRNGKGKDPKTGIRILYQSAKDNPVAQKIFVDRWSNGDLDGSLGVLSSDEYDMIIPWFKDAWDRGNKRAGLILGNDAYLRKKYSLALEYWKGSGLAYSWYLVGRFYSTYLEEGKGGGPEKVRDETKSRKAFEICLTINSNFEDAKIELSFIYLWPQKSENENLYKARDYFSYFLKKHPNNEWYNYGYGVAGYRIAIVKFFAKWPESEMSKLISLSKQFNDEYSAFARMPKWERERIKKDYEMMCKDFDETKSMQEKYIFYIKKAANLGLKPAQDYLSSITED